MNREQLFRHPMAFLHPSSTSELHVIEESDCEDDFSASPLSEDEGLTPMESNEEVDQIEENIDAWDEMRNLSRSIGSSLLKAQASSLKKRVREVVLYCATVKNTRKDNAKQEGAENVDVGEEKCSRKKRRFSNSAIGLGERNVRQEQENLVKKMDRMRRMASILQRLDMAHSHLRSELDDLLDEAQREHMCDEL
jgi:hypothetical protein